jgi:hypothetical protein
MYGENMERFERAKRRFETEPLGENSADGGVKSRPPKDMSAWTKKYDDFMP